MPIPPDELIGTEDDPTGEDAEAETLLYQMARDGDSLLRDMSPDHRARRVRDRLAALTVRALASCGRTSPGPQSELGRALGSSYGHPRARAESVAPSLRSARSL